MANIWLPAESDFALALREPNLLLPGKKPLGEVKIKNFSELVNARLVIPAFHNGFNNLAKYFVTSPSTSNLSSVFYEKGHAIRFNDNSYINWGSGEYDFLLNQTFTQWIRVRWFTGNASNTMIWNIGLRSDIQIGSLGELEYQYYDGTFRILSAGAAPSSGESIIHVVRRQGVGTRLFLNGALVDSNTLSGDIVYASGRDAGIGKRTTSSAISSAYFDLLDAGYVTQAWSDDVVLRHANNPTYFYEPANDTPYLFPVAGGGGVSQELTGNSSTTAVGTLGVTTEGSVSATPGGVSATAAVGTLGAIAEINASAELTGVSSSGAVGTITAEVGGGTTANLLGNESAASVGTLGVSTEVNAFVDLLGNSATGAVGTLIVVTGLQVALSGNAATGAVGTLGVTAEVNASAALTGVGSSGAVGTLEVTVPIAVSVELTGVGSTGAIGTLTAVGAGQVWTEITPVSTIWTEIS